MTISPAVSVLMSCFNGERWLGEAIESVLAQTFKDFEFVIVDDGSTDSSFAVAESFARRDRRIVILRKRNSGLADSLNAGIARVRGLWVARLDADDRCDPERLGAQYELAGESRHLVFIGTSSVEVDTTGQRRGSFRYPLGHAALLRNLTTVRRFPAHSSAFINVEALRSVGGYRTRIRRAEDHDLWLRLSEVGELACIDRPLVQIRKHKHQISHEAGGWAQLVDCRVATVSYWLRRIGAEDPVEADDPTFQLFRSWVEERCTAANLKEYAEFRSSISAGRVSSRASPILNPRNMKFVFRYLRERSMGEALTEGMASDWLRRGRVCAE